MPEGEVQQPPKDGDQNEPPQSPPQDSQQQQNPPAAGTPPPDKPGDKGGDGDGSPTVEDQLDAEKAKNLQLAKELTKAKADAAKAEGEKDVAKERDEFKAENTKLKGMLESRYLIWCIGTDKKYNWQNPEDVVKFLNPEELNIDVEKEKIDGLDLALKRVAKEKPYLLVPAEGDEGTGGQPLRPTGTTPGAGRTGTRETEVKRLGAKYKIPGFGTAADKFM
jgi:hypothetical protein